jgi:hypothetical protein
MPEIGTYPLWLAAIVVGARYGLRGLVVVVVLAAGHAAATIVDGGAGVAAREIGAMAAAVAVAVLSELNERRNARLREERDLLSRRVGVAERTAEQLRDRLTSLQERSHRLGESLCTLRDLARRIERGDPIAAAEAALELALARTGAVEGVVVVVTPLGLRQLARRGPGPGASRPPLADDGTVATAITRRRAVVAGEAGGAPGPADSDAAAPIAPGGQPVGALALRGLPAAFRAGGLEELSLIADWFSDTLGPRAGSAAG